MSALTRRADGFRVHDDVQQTGGPQFSIEIYHVNPGLLPYMTTRYIYYS